MEETDRHTGIRVHSTESVTVGKSVTVTGTMATTPGGERYIEATSVTTDTGTAIKPLAANSRALEADLMEGLLVKVAGTVATVGSNYYTITDGYTKDGTPVETKIMTGSAPGVTTGQFVTVKGIASYDGTRVILQVP
jgi:autotransporter adhesin